MRKLAQHAVENSGGLFRRLTHYALRITLVFFTAAAPAQDFDLVLANGHVLDPESRLDTVRHVGIREGVIRAVSETPLRGRTVVDASGLVIAPGFIDLHQHAHQPEDYHLKAQDGVTAAFELEVGTADVDAWYAARAGKALIHHGVSVGHIRAAWPRWATGPVSCRARTP
jgi:hypothetical protein